MEDYWGPFSTIQIDSLKYKVNCCKTVGTQHKVVPNWMYVGRSLLLARTYNLCTSHYKII